MTNPNRILRQQDYEGLPDNPELRFAHLEEMARDRLFEILSHTEDINNTNYSARRQYVGTVQGLLRSIGREPISFGVSNEYLDDFEEFLENATSITTEFRLRNTEWNDSESVKISQRSRNIIENSIFTLRNSIDESDLSELKKSRLHGKLDDLLSELRRPRVRLGVVLGAVAAVSFAIGGTTSFLADAPAAVGTINKIIEIVAEEKAQEEEFLDQLHIEQERLGMPPERPKLTDQTSERQNRSALDFSSDADEELPF